MEGGSQGSYQSSENGNLANPARGDWFNGVDSIVRTEVEYSDYKFVWEIRNFRELIYRGSKFESPTFVDPKTNNIWKLYVNPKERLDGADYVGVGLGLLEHGTHDESLQNALVTFHYAIRVLDENGLGSIQNGETEGMRSIKRGKGVWVQKLLDTNEILKGRLLPDGILRLHITTITELGFKHSVLKNDRGSTPPVAPVEFVAAEKNGFKITRQGPMKPNVILIAQGERFPAHRDVLEGGSGTFRDLFADNDDAIEVTIPDFCPPVVEAFLDFIYKDDVSFAVLQAHAPEILRMATIYGVGELKELCEGHLVKWITVSNAAYMHVFADTVGSMVLSDAIARFIDSKRNEVLQSDGFKEMLAKKPALFSKFNLR